MPSLGFGIVGCGMIAHFHARAIGELKGARLVGCTSARRASSDQFAGEYDIFSYADLPAMLSDPAIDVVCICTPSGAHLEPARLAAEAGKHVVVEKPLEVTLKRCDALIAACAKHGVQLCAIFPSRFGAANLALKDAIDAGRFGTLTLGDTYVKWYRTQEYYDSGGWRGTWQLDGGGALMNQAIHNVDLLYWLMGDVAELSGQTATLAHERIEVEDVAIANLKFRNGALGVIEATTTAWPGLLKRTEIHGTTGSVIVEQDDILQWQFAKPRAKDAALVAQLSRASGSSGGASDPKAISHVGHREQLKDFLRAIRTGSPPAVTGAEGRKSIEIILATYQSAWTGKRVMLPLAKDPQPPRSKPSNPTS